jgi:PKD repeat protein
MRVKLIFLFSLFTFQIWAQNTEIGKCATDYLESEIRNNNPELDQKFQELDAFNRELAQTSDQSQKTSAAILTVPVVVHVMYADETDNITMDQIIDAIDVINIDFRRQNADTILTRSIFQSVAADMEIEFKLARLDPSGNCTDGVNRVQTNQAIDANDNVKPLSHWDNKKYLNIWVVRNILLPNQPSGTVLGYAYRPNPGQSYKRDGVVIRHDMMGRIGTATGIGRTLTHEVGHYLGLQHPFNNGCFGGDNCTDTPPVASSSSGCNLNRNSCSNDNPDLPDQIENYMDYADDECTNMFTQQQSNIMRGNLNNNTTRGYLISGNNPSNTGIVDGQALSCKPEVKYSTSSSIICEGENIQFTDKTLYGNPVSYNWSFPGGQPASSTAKNPNVTYNTKGSYNVSLTVTNAQGNSSITEYNKIAVRPIGTPVWLNGFSESFEQWNVPNNNWFVEADVDTIDFYTAQNTGFNSNRSAKLNNFDIESARTINLISNSIDFTNSKSVNLKFDYAYTSKSNPSSVDVLRIYTSTDCGKTWSIKRNISGANLFTASATNNRFTPNGTSQWKSADYTIFGINFAPSVMFKFEFFAKGSGNNFYLDNVKLVTAIGVEEEKLGLSRINIFPNPTAGDFNIELDVIQQDIFNINLLDINGRLVDVILKDEKLSIGKYRLESNSSIYLAKGVYLIEIKNSKGSKIEKLILQ